MFPKHTTKIHYYCSFEYEETDLRLQRGPCQGACVFVHTRLLCAVAHATAADAAVV